MRKRLRRRLLSVTKKDLVIETSRSDSGVRIIHPDSGARGESREHQSQKLNKEAAFSRLVLSDTFQTWLRVETTKVLNKDHDIHRRASRDVERMMVPSNLKVEVRRDGRWREEPRDGN